MEKHKYEKIIGSGFWKIGLYPRNSNIAEPGLDRHVAIDILIGSDSYLTRPEGISSYWMADIIDVMIDAHNWIVENCKEDKDGYFEFL
jgi:hypothetical protein